MHGAPAYIGEMSPSHIRGTMVGMKEAFIVVGIELGYIMGYALEGHVESWVTLYGIAAVPSIGMMAGMFFLPPSTRWLALRGKRVEAAKSLRYVQPDVGSECIDEIAAVAARHELGDEPKLKDLIHPRCRQALIVGVGVVILQQVTGQPTILYYVDKIFLDVGLSTAASIGVGFFKLVMTLLAVYNVDRFGRKTLLTVGCWVLLAALSILALAFLFPYTSEADCNAYLNADECPSATCSYDPSCSCDDVSDDDTCTCCSVSGLTFQKFTIIFAMLVYIGGYQIGFGPVGWLLVSEIFPLEVRGKAISVAVIANFVSNLFVTFTFPQMLEIVGTSMTFFLFALVDVYAIYFVGAWLPETKGLSLEEIENLFQFHAHRPSSSVSSSRGGSDEENSESWRRSQ